MIKIFIIVSAICTIMWAFKYENCVSDPTSAAYIWLNFDMFPLPVLFPDDLHMRVNTRILKNLTRPVVDIELYRKDPLTGSTVQMPCIPGTFIGTCQNIDLCTVIDRMNNISANTGPPSFQEQIDEVLTTPLGRHKECPILATPSSDKNFTIKLQPQSTFVLQILKGDYMMKLIVKDDPTSKTDIGCLKFNFTIAGAAPVPPTTTPTTTLSGPIQASESYPVG